MQVSDMLVSAAFFILMLGQATADFSPHSHKYVFDAPKIHVQARVDSFTASHGVIGLSTNGIPFVQKHYDRDSNGFLNPRELEREFDNCGGHGDTDGHYHYHFAPTCLLKALGSVIPSSESWWHGRDTLQHWPKLGKAVRVGIALDGSAIYNPYHPTDGSVLAAPQLGHDSPLDECHGMHMPNGDYAYFLTASQPFLPPCLRYRPAELQGFEEKGELCASRPAANLPGCPDHPWFLGSTEDNSLSERRLACGTCGTEGFLSDKLCWEKKTAADGADMLREPWKHTVACMLMPPCEASGYVLIRPSTADPSTFVLNATLDAEGNKLAKALLSHSCSKDNFAVRVTGKYCGTTMKVTSIAEITSGYCGAKCGTTTCGTKTCGTCGTKACGTCGTKTCGTCGIKTCGTCGTKTCGTCGTKTCGTCGTKTCGTCGTKTCGTKTCGTCGTKNCGICGTKTCGTKTCGTCTKRSTGVSTMVTKGGCGGATANKASDACLHAVPVIAILAMWLSC